MPGGHACVTGPGTRAARSAASLHQRRGSDRRVLRHPHRLRGPRTRKPAARSTVDRRACPPSVRERPTRWSFSPAVRARARRSLARQVREAFRTVQRDRDIVLVDQRGTGKSNPLNCRSDANSLREIDRIRRGRALDRLKRLPRGIRRRRPPLHDDHRDGRSRRRARASRLRAHQPVRRLIRHARRARLPPPARRSRALDDPRRRGADRHAAAAVHRARCAARARQAARRLRRRCRVPRGVSRTAGAHPRRCCSGSSTTPPRVRIVHPRTGVAEDVRVEARVVASILFGALVLAADRVARARAGRSRRAATTSRACSRSASPAKAPTRT